MGAVYAWKEVKMEIVMWKGKDTHKAFIYCRGRITKTGAKKLIENEGIKVKKILKIELAEARFGCYVYFQRR